MRNLKQVLIITVLLLFSLGAMANNPEKVAVFTKEAKATKAERPLVTSFFGGMMLTKVTLESHISLVPYAHQEDADYAEQCESLIGLVVYHKADKTNKSLPSGMYVWDGEKWQQASFEY